jgi:pimeloyl-ACP methyl ester carboxylesterase
MTLLDTGAARVFHRKLGTGPDLIFVHGWPLHGETWRAIAPRLASRFTCHILDLPGAGKSEWTAATPITLRAHAAAVLRAIELLGLDRVGFVAHDSGGAVARLAAAELGARAFGLVLGNTELPGYTPPTLQTFVRITRLPGGGRLLPLIARIPLLRRSKYGFAGAFHDRSLIDGEFFTLFLAPLLASRRATAGQVALIRQFDLEVLDELAAVHARITAPVQLIWGADDRWFPVDRARAMLDQFAGGAELVELPRARVFAHEEYPAAWADHAAGFLARAVARRAA